MAEKNGVYKCDVCGNVVSVVHASVGTLVCCGKNMTLLQPKTSAQEGKEKHVPVVEVSGSKVTVKIGSIPHPMEEKHYIEMIQLLKDDKVIAERRLFPGEAPVAVFEVEDAEGIKAREYCNLHGLWTN